MDVDNLDQTDSMSVEDELWGNYSDPDDEMLISVQETESR
jgi:hypothetical protein